MWQALAAEVAREFAQDPLWGSVVEAVYSDVCANRARVRTNYRNLSPQQKAAYIAKVRARQSSPEQRERTAELQRARRARKRAEVQSEGR